jgi:hypothetical protein
LLQQKKVAKNLDQKTQTDVLEEPRPGLDFSQNISPEESKVSEIKPQSPHMLSNKSTRSEQNKIRDMQEAMIKLQEQVVTIRIENKTLKKASTAKGNYIQKSAISLYMSYLLISIFQCNPNIDDKIRFLSAPNADMMQTDFKMNLSNHVESNPIIEENRNYTDIDSELIDDDSILDYDEKQEIIENVFNESSESELNCYSELTQEEHKVQPMSAREHKNENEQLEQKEMNGHARDRSIQDYQPAGGRIWKL